MDKIICLGKNYVAHAEEMREALPEQPVIFLKPASVLKQVKDWQTSITAQFPNDECNVVPECEIILRIQGDRVQNEFVIDAVTVGLDMTLRDRQQGLKEKGHPWTIAKVFRDAAIIGPWINVVDFPEFLSTEFTLSINQRMRQQGIGQEMLMKPKEMLAYIAKFFPLCSGDIIFTGTPAGVGNIDQNDIATLAWGDYSFTVKWR